MKDTTRFVLKTLFYFVIFMVLIYFFSYLGRGQGNFIYNEFQKGKRFMLHDMIERIEHFAQTQGDFPVYNLSLIHIFITNFIGRSGSY